MMTRPFTRFEHLGAMTNPEHSSGAGEAIVDHRTRDVVARTQLPS